jgi:hypothetical protein
MKTFLSICILCLTMPVLAQNFHTGDARLEAELRGINLDARKNLRTFKAGISADFGVPVVKLDKMLSFMQPAEVVLTLRIARIRHLSVDRVIQSYRVNKHKGWGAIARDMGIKPGSSQFHAMKGNGKKYNGGNRPGGGGNPHHSHTPSNSGGSHGNAHGNGHGNGNGSSKSNGKGKH